MKKISDEEIKDLLGDSPHQSNLKAIQAKILILALIFFLLWVVFDFVPGYITLILISALILNWLRSAKKPTRHIVSGNPLYKGKKYYKEALKQKESDPNFSSDGINTSFSSKAKEIWNKAKNKITHKDKNEEKLINAANKVNAFRKMKEELKNRNFEDRIRAANKSKEEMENIKSRRKKG